MHTLKTSVLPIALVLTLVASGYLGYLIWTLARTHATLTETLTAREEDLGATHSEISRLTALLASTTVERDSLQEALTTEQKKNGTFEEQINKITGTVGKLDKLSKTDPQLLQKYSKVFFLNEHYVPAILSSLEKEYVYDESKEFYLTTSVIPFFKKMISVAKEDGVTLFVESAYRSFETQAGLKSQYKVTYGSGANTFSADQGYSEHQLGTTIDFTTTGINGGLGGFEKTPAYTWLTENAHTYGFVLSYPKGNTYYIFEPWHWRFVGVKLARVLHRDGKYFYDLDQRAIDKYLISIFD